VTRTVEDLGQEIERRWTQLGEGPHDSELKILDLPQTVAGVPVYLAVGADGARLLVPFAKDAHRSFRPDTRSKGVHLSARQLEQEGVNRWFLDVVCTRSELRWLFSSFVADILLRFRRHPELDPTTIVRTCFEAWRALFAGAERRLGIKQLAGLFGELTLLARLLDRSPSAIRLWRGPLREPHDFVSPGLDIEVKTTLSSEDDVVHIHGLEQLAAPPEGRLHLAHLRVEVPSPDGESVPHVVDRLKTVDTTGKLVALLEATGYHDEHRDSYADLAFTLVEERWFEVGDGFPRLSPQSFPNGEAPTGLTDFRYSLDLSCVTALPLSDAVVADVIAAIVS
jgi:hypothetical protein